MVRMGFEKIIPEFSISKVIVGADRFAGVCLTSLPSDQLRNHLLLFSIFGLEGINNSFTICSVSDHFDKSELRFQFTAPYMDKFGFLAVLRKLRAQLSRLLAGELQERIFAPKGLFV